MKLALVTVLFMSFLMEGVAQTSLDPVVLTSETGPEFYSKFNRSVAPVLCAGGKYGTGTLIQFPHCDTCISSGLLLITNEHVVRNSDIVAARYHLVDGGTEDIQHKVLFRDEKNDLAVLQRTDFSLPYSSYERLGIDTSWFATSANYREGSLVYVLGYPLELGLATARPVLQQGILALVDSVNNEIYIDLPANPGNSGGPAFILHGNRWKLLGIVYKYKEVLLPVADGLVSLSHSGMSRVLPIDRLVRHVKDIIANRE